jgi:hypothetical protein
MSLAHRAPATHGGALFCCSPASEALAQELADLVGGSWETVTWVSDVMIMANGATIPHELPARASRAASNWWNTAVTTTLARRNDGS